MVFIGPVFHYTIKTCLKRVGHYGYEWVENEMCRRTHCTLNRFKSIFVDLIMSYSQTNVDIWPLVFTAIKYTHLLTCTCSGIHPGWIEPASSDELTTSGSTVQRKLTRDFHPAFSSSCMAEDSGSGERFQLCLECGSAGFQLACEAVMAKWGPLQRGQTSRAFIQRTVARRICASRVE